jgi:signal transduction histidine kinase
MNNHHIQINGTIENGFLNKRQKFFIIFVIVFFVTILHYITAVDYGLRHVFLRELYFLPIMLAAFWFGLLGGLGTSLLISLVYGPYILLYAPGSAIHNLGNMLELVLFNVVGLFFGWMKDRETIQQQKLRQAENLAAIGRAVSMVAHDLKTPLVAIGGLSRQLSKKLEGDSPHGEKVEVIRQQASRLENMVFNMLDFAKPLTITIKPCDLNRLLRQAVEIVYEAASKRNITIDMQKNWRTVLKVDEGKILQVLINLISNAIEASPEGETVTVSTQSHLSLLIIDVSDRGAGIDKSIAGDIFEPFISNKRKGTGLGLSISKKIVEAHSGKLEYINNSEAGATFRVSIPAIQ